MELGDTVLYKSSSGLPSRSDMNVHPAVVTKVLDNDHVDLTVFFHGYPPEPVWGVPMGHPDMDVACWWPRILTAVIQ